MPKAERIEINPAVCNGKPVIRGTRIPVSVLLALLAEGESWEEILSGYPELKPEDLQAALNYARDLIEHTEEKAVAS
ncbi:MAG: antitoxin [Deltaproteobacteria bacterium RBG_13_61_14]|nr:MAG: antitoxin [Deltaproteobacteria bacterium RBG_13_61_14]